jgi:hypothetical protein
MQWCQGCRSQAACWSGWHCCEARVQPACCSLQVGLLQPAAQCCLTLTICSALVSSRLHNGFTPAQAGLKVHTDVQVASSSKAWHLKVHMNSAQDTNTIWHVCKLDNSKATQLLY